MSGSNWESDPDLYPHRFNLFGYCVDNVGLQDSFSEFDELQILDQNPRLVTELGLGSRIGAMRRTPNHNRTQRGGTMNSAPRTLFHKTFEGIPIRKVYVRNICNEVTRTDLMTMFMNFGRIVELSVIRSRSDETKQCAFVTYLHPEEATRVINKKTLKIRGRRLYISAADSWHQPRENRNGEVIWKRKKKTSVEEDGVEEDSVEEDSEVDDEATEGSEEFSDEGLNVLNDDCLLHIFSFLTLKEIAGFERVCKRWKRLSYQTWSFVRKLNFNDIILTKSDLKSCILEQYLKRCGQGLTLLDLSLSTHSFDDKIIFILTKYCPNLEVLKISNLVLAKRSLASLGYRCPKLKELVMENCAKIYDSDLMSLLTKCYELNHLELAHMAGFSGKFLVSINSPVSYLKFQNCPQVVPKLLFPGLQKLSRTLQSFTLNSCCGLYNNEVEDLVRFLPNLTSLTVCRSCDHLNSSSLLSIGQLSKLTELNLSQNTAVSDALLKAIAENCKNLTSVILSASGQSHNVEITEIGLCKLAKLPKLTDLNISYLEFECEVVLQSLASHCHQLKRLWCQGCPDLTDDGSSLLISMCNELELFDLSGCKNIGMPTVIAARVSVKMRTNNVRLNLIVGGTEVYKTYLKEKESLLNVDFNDFSEEHLRPDYIDDIFFPLSDDDSYDEEHLLMDHLLEGLLDAGYEDIGAVGIFI